MKLHGCQVVTSFLAAWLAMSAGLIAAQSAGPETTQPSSGLNIARLLTESRHDAAALAEKKTALEEVLDKAVEPLDRAEAELALANWLLAAPTATPATRLLLDVAGPNDCKALAEAAADADVHLKNAEERIRAARKDRPADAEPSETQPATPASSPADGESAEDHSERLRSLQKSLANLQAFAEVLAAPGVEGDEETRQAAWSRAARAVARLREAARDEVAACATLWQAFAWQKAGRSERAQASLPEALLPPGDSPYAFLLRIFRCQLLSDEEQFPVASVLALRVRQACQEWFANEPPDGVAARQRLVALVEARIGQAWARQLDQAGEAENADRLRQLLAKIEQTVFPDGADSGPVYCLPFAIPIIAAPPTLVQASPHPSTKKAVYHLEVINTNSATIPEPITRPSK